MLELEREAGLIQEGGVTHEFDNAGVPNSQNSRQFIDQDVHKSEFDTLMTEQGNEVVFQENSLFSNLASSQNKSAGGSHVHVGSLTTPLDYEDSDGIDQ